MSGSQSPTYQIRLSDAHTGALQAIVANWSDLSWTCRTIEAGLFTLGIPAGQIDATLALSDPLLEIRRNGARAFDGMVTYTTYDPINERWQFQGQDLKWLLSGRTVVPPSGQEFDAVAGVPAETAIKGYVSRHLAAPADGPRNINTELNGITFTVEANQGRGPNVSYNGRYANLLTTVTQLARESGLWFDVVRTATGYEFQVYDVADATSTSAQPVVFTMTRGNVLQQTYERDHTGIENTIYVLGEGEAELRTVEVVADSASQANHFRRETSLDSRNNETTAALQQDGQAYLAASLAHAETVMLVPAPAAIRDYPDRWDVGSEVTFSIPELGVVINKVIVEVNVQSVSDTGEQITIALGDRPETLQRMIAEGLTRLNRVAVR